MNKFYKNKFEKEGYEFLQIKNKSYNYIGFNSNFCKLILYIEDNSTSYKKDLDYYLKKYSEKIENFSKEKSFYYQIKEVWIKPKNQTLFQKTIL